MIEEMEELITLNQIRLSENEYLIDRVERESRLEQEKIPFLQNDILKRCSLRRIRSYRKRIEVLQQCSTIYNDNINVHSEMIDRLEDMRVAGLKNISVEMLEEIALDNEEMYRKHKEIIDSTLIFRDEFEPPDHELEELAKELGL